VESATWAALTDVRDHDHLERTYPIRNLNRTPPRDLATAPYGRITAKGLERLRSVGSQLRSTFPHLTTDRVKVFATNYQRTQASAQALLTGLYDTHTSTPSPPAGVHVHVRPTPECPLAFYEGNPVLSTQLLQLSQSSPDFVAHETSDEARYLREALAAALPGVQHDGKFDWMAAFDYYVCREEHGLAVAPEVGPLALRVKEHLHFRYNHYCRHPQHLAHVCVPLLTDIRTTLAATLVPGSSSDSSSSSGSSSAALTIFSGHDISLLFLLHCLQSDLVASKDRHGAPFWPYFGSSLLFDAHLPPHATSVADAVVDVHYDLAALPVAVAPGGPKATSFTVHQLDSLLRTLRTQLLNSY
jgi:hypothetical protein